MNNEDRIRLEWRVREGQANVKELRRDAALARKAGHRKEADAYEVLAKGVEALLRDIQAAIKEHST